METASGASATMETATHAAMEAAATASMETTAPTTMKAATAAMKTAATATARRHDIGCKHSKCCSRQQRERDFTEHD
jgi:hypothetical protein